MTWLVEAIHWVFCDSYKPQRGLGSDGITEPVLIHSANEDNTFFFPQMYIKHVFNCFV